MYKIEPNGQIIRIDGAVIPRDVTNPAYQQFIHWQAHSQHPMYVPIATGDPKQEVKLEPVTSVLAKILGK